MRGHLIQKFDPERGAYTVIRFANGSERPATEADMAGLRADAINQATLSSKIASRPDPAAGVEDPARAEALRRMQGDVTLGASEAVSPEQTTGQSTLSWYERGVFHLFRDKSRFGEFLEDRTFRATRINGYGGYAFKRTKDSPWEFVRPDELSNSGMVDFVSDFLAPALASHGGTLLGGAAGFALGGPPGAVVGAITGSVAGQGGVEAARQGVTGESDPGRLAMELASGAMMVPEMKAAGYLGGKAANIAKEGATSIGARVAGTADSRAMPREIAFMGRATGPRKILEAMPTPERAMRQLQTALGVLTQKNFRFPEKIQADAILKNLSQSGATVDMSAVDNYLRNWLTVPTGKTVSKTTKKHVETKATSGKPFGAAKTSENIRDVERTVIEPEMLALDERIRRKIAADETIPKGVRSLLDKLRTYTRGARMDQLPAEQADGVLEILSDMARAEGVYGKHNTPITDQFKIVIRDAREKARSSVEAAAGPAWGGLNKEVSRKLDHLHEVRRSSGWNEPNAETRKRLMESWVSDLYGDNTTDSTIAAIQEIEKLSGVDLSIIRESAIGRAVGHSTVGGQARFGVPQFLPKLTATGGILGASAIGGILGYREGGIEGGLAGAIGGAALAAPRNVYRLAGAAASKPGQAIGKAGAFLVSETARVGAVQANRAAIPAAVSVVTSDDGRRKRGPTVLD